MYVLKDGASIDVSMLGSGGGGTTQLEARLTNVEATLPQKAESTDLADLSGIVTLKAEQSDLNAWAPIG